MKAPADALAYILYEIAMEMGTEKATAAYYDGEDTYVLQGDGVAGLQDSDVVVVLAGVDATGSLDTILI